MIAPTSKQTGKAQMAAADAEVPEAQASATIPVIKAAVGIGAVTEVPVGVVTVAAGIGAVTEVPVGGLALARDGAHPLLPRPRRVSVCRAART
jgi:hypothetical protein